MNGEASTQDGYRVRDDEGGTRSRVFKTREEADHALFVLRAGGVPGADQFYVTTPGPTKFDYQLARTLHARHQRLVNEAQDAGHPDPIKAGTTAMLREMIAEMRAGGCTWQRLAYLITFSPHMILMILRDEHEFAATGWRDGFTRAELHAEMDQGEDGFAGTPLHVASLDVQCMAIGEYFLNLSPEERDAEMKRAFRGAGHVEE